MLDKLHKQRIHAALEKFRRDGQLDYIGVIGRLTKRQKREADAELRRNGCEPFTTNEILINHEGMAHLNKRTDKDDYTIKQIVNAIENGLSPHAVVVPGGANEDNRVMLRLEVGKFTVLLERDHLGRPSLFNAYSNTSGKLRERNGGSAKK